MRLGRVHTPTCSTESGGGLAGGGLSHQEYRWLPGRGQAVGLGETTGTQLLEAASCQARDRHPMLVRADNGAESTPVDNMAWARVL